MAQFALASRIGKGRNVMSGWEITGIILGIIILILLVINAKDLWRYIKISNM
ncbi:hypothetical protein [Methylocystis hirsuta]|uniref:hypothetical protein n=1 Tax=Methylocystis hirsuta TaxID=369798 RepID=UPI0014761398|nr:hypothetical protein [Methylocystis hirsuta]